MRLKAPAQFFHSALSKPWPDEVNQILRYESGSRLVRVPLHVFPDDVIEQLYKATKASNDPKIQRLGRKIEDYRALSTNPTGEGVGKLERLVVAMTAYVRRSPNKIVFMEGPDAQMLPYYVTGIKYHPRNKRNETDAHVTMSLTAISRGNATGKTLTWWRHDLTNKPKVSRLLNAEGAYLETEEAYANYLKELEAYNAMRDDLGKLYVGDGYDDSGNALVRDGIPAKLVLDDTCERETDREATGRGSDNGLCSTLFWLEAKKKMKVEGRDEDDEDEPAEEEDEEDAENSYVTAAPVHPYVQLFDLDKHCFVDVHVSNLKLYKFREGMDEKLVLPEHHRELINLLVQGAAEVMEDIIAGKTGGVVVACTGEPGTGKTLTAEICAEHIKKPLYMVQCSQLGTNEEQLETKLQLVLRRASRWGAILLIDEADVYVRERGADIVQNAIVGVFLRLLERYRGVLFLTSNRATIIDDAVMSRCIAHVRYEAPEGDDLRRIWTILAENYGVELSKADLDELLAKFPRISGRNVKNLLKLATMVAKSKKSKVTAKSIINISSFVELLKAGA